MNLFFKKNQERLQKLYPGLQEDYFQDVLDKIFERFLEGYPLEYLMGGKYFYNGWIHLGEEIFIPRYESEWLVEEALKIVQKDDQVLDLCCGPGTLGIALLRARLDVFLTFVDEDSRALFYVEKNSAFAPDKVTIQKSNLFDNIQNSFDLILVNPPYLKKDSWVHPQTRFESPKALYIPRESFIEELVIGLKKFLKPEGTFLMEGDEDFLRQVEIKAYQENFEITLLRDLTDKWRYIKGTFAKKA